MKNNPIPAPVVALGDRLAQRLGAGWTRLEDGEWSMNPRSRSLRIATTAVVVHIHQTFDIIVNGLRYRSEDEAVAALAEMGL